MTYLSGVIASGSLSLLALVAASTPEAASVAASGVGYTIVVALLGLATKWVAEFYADRKDARANSILRMQAENAARMAAIEADREAEKERRWAERDYENALKIEQRNEIDALRSRIQSLTDGQRVNGNAIRQIAGPAGVEVRVADPPAGTDDMPTLP